MGFWLFMAICSILVPMSMVGIGWLFRNKAPDDINRVYGYRTQKSMQSKEAWAFAHKYIGKLWLVCGLIMLPVSIAVMLFVMGEDVDTVGAAGGILVGVQIIIMAGTIIPTERALKKLFPERQ